MLNLLTSKTYEHNTYKKNLPIIAKCQLKAIGEGGGICGLKVSADISVRNAYFTCSLSDLIKVMTIT